MPQLLLHQLHRRGNQKIQSVINELLKNDALLDSKQKIVNLSREWSQRESKSCKHVTNLFLLRVFDVDNNRIASEVKNKHLIIIPEKKTKEKYKKWKSIEFL